MKKTDLLIPVSLALCIAITIVFAANVASSRRELPASLLDLCGDTSGIRKLSIEGLIADYANKYAYSFEVSPQSAATDVRIHKSADDASKDTGLDYPFVYPSEYAYIPIGETRSETRYSENAYQISRDGQMIPLKEYRIYADLYEVIPCINEPNLPLALDPDKGKLYVDGTEIGYIYAVDHNGGYEEYQMNTYRPGYSVERSVRLHSELSVGDKCLLVPTGAGFYGHTALYAVEMPGGHVSTLQSEGENQAYVVAEELYPIELERGDEILGLIELNGGILLAIRRGGGFELIRADPEAWECIAVYTEGEPWLNRYYLMNNSLVLISEYWNYGYPDVHAFDLREGGLERVASIKSANLWEGVYDNVYNAVEAAIWKDGALYAAFRTGNAMSSDPDEVQIAALSATGGLIGRCRLLCGIEEDYAQLWIRGVGSVNSGYKRELRRMTLR